MIQITLMTSKHPRPVKRISALFLALASVFAMVGCQPEIVPDNIAGSVVEFTINTSAPSTKTYIEYDGSTHTYTPYWNSNDKIGVFFDSWTANTSAVKAIFTNTLSDGLKASFSGKGTVSSSEQTIYAFYPAGVFAKAYDNQILGFSIPSIQKPTASSFDKDADILVAKPYPITISSTSVEINDMRFARILSTLKLTVADGTSQNLLSNDHIQSITLTSDMQDAALTGWIRWSFANEAVVDVSVKRSNVTADLTANPIAIDGASPIYFLVNPTTLTSGSNLVITITTDNHVITKTAALPKDFVFPAGQVANLGITIKDTDSVEEPTNEPEGTGWYKVENVNWLKAGDKVVITNAASNFAISTTQNNNNRAAVAVTLKNDGTLNIGETVDQFTLVEGNTAGSFAFKGGDNKYLYAVSGNNYLRSKTATTIDAVSSWTISINATGTKVFNVGASAYEIQKNNSNATFSCYKSTQTAILLYKYYQGLAPLGDLSISLTPDETNRTVTVTWTDLPDATNYEVTCTGQSVQDIAPGVQSVVFSDLAYDTEYTITVTATADGYMSSSATESITLEDPDAKVITALKSTIANVPSKGVNATENAVYELSNATDADLTVTTDGTVVTSASANSGNVTYSVAENNGIAREGWIKIAVADGNEIEITVSQAALFWASVYTSNVTMSVNSETLAYEGIVNIDGTGYNAVKVGKANESGSMTITVPAHKTRLFVHAAAWKGVTNSSLTITSNNATPSPSSISLTANSGITNTSPYNFYSNPSPSSSSYFFMITLPDSNQETTLTFAGDQRFVIWGCNVDDIAVVTTGGANVKSSGSAILTGSFVGATGTVGASGFLWGNSKTNLNNDIQLGSQAGTEGTLEYELTGLIYSTTYYYQAYVQVWDEDSHEYKTRYGEVRSFTTWEADTSVHTSWLELPAVTGTEDYVGEFFGSNGIDRNYSYNYNYDHYGCLWVAYPLTKSHLTGSPSSSWALNPNIASDKQVWVADNAYGVHYGDDTYDRGHQIPNADRKSDATMNAQTYYVTNQTPQKGKGLNQDIWQQLESAVRAEVPDNTADTIYVATGACCRTVNGNENIQQLTGVANLVGKPTNPMALDIPNYFWKVLLKVKRTNNVITSAQAIGFWFENKVYQTGSNYDTDYYNYALSVDEIEQRTGFDLFTNLPASLQATAEANTSWSDFQNF